MLLNKRSGKILWLTYILKISLFILKQNYIKNYKKQGEILLHFLEIWRGTRGKYLILEVLTETWGNFNFKLLLVGTRGNFFF